MQGFIGDVGDLMKLVMAKSGVRSGEDIDRRLAHELADCLWSVLVLAKLYNVDLASAFTGTMDEIEGSIAHTGSPRASSVAGERRNTDSSPR